jgi:hypothetical protein
VPLCWLSLAGMSAEGVVGLYFGVQANPVSLVGGALGSVSEGLASVIAIWRFSGSWRLSEAPSAGHSAASRSRSGCSRRSAPPRRSATYS